MQYIKEMLSQIKIVKEGKAFVLKTETGKTLSLPVSTKKEAEGHRQALAHDLSILKTLQQAKEK